MTAKVRIKAGLVEFEYEGETEFSIDDVKDLFSHIETLFSVPSLARSPDELVEEKASSEEVSVPTVENGEKLHINTIATKLGVKSCTDLAMAAAAYLHIMEDRKRFTKNDLLEVMKNAENHYSANMSSNLRKSLKTLVKDKFNQLHNGEYSIRNDTLNELRSKIA